MWLAVSCVLIAFGHVAFGPVPFLFACSRTHNQTARVDSRWIYHMHALSNVGGPGIKSQGSQALYLDKIFSVIGVTNKFFVEFGFNEQCYTCGGSGANTWNLYDAGWRGLLLDGNNKNSSINLQAHYLFASNVASILKSYSVPSNLDFLSCDMDSHDLFVFEAILRSGFRPRVITTEYNSNYPLNMSIALIDPELLSSSSSDYTFSFVGCAWGASASAYNLVARQHGYTLIGRVGVLDLVWLRDDLFDRSWSVPSFEWFFQHNFPAPGLGELLHSAQTSQAILKRLIDVDYYLKTHDVHGSINRAAQQVLNSRLPCFAGIV